MKVGNNKTAADTDRRHESKEHAFYVPVVISLLLAIGMAGCSNSQVNDSAPAVSSQNGGTPSSIAAGVTVPSEPADGGSSASDGFVYADGSAGIPNNGIPVENAPSLNGYYVLSADKTYLTPIVERNTQLTHGLLDTIDKEKTEERFDIYSGADCTTIASGEKIVVCGDAYNGYSPVGVYQVIEQGYWQGPDAASAVNDYDEIEGTPTDTIAPGGAYDFPSVNGFLAPYGVEYHHYYYRAEYGRGYFMFKSPTPTTLSAGWYKGTLWKDGVIRIDTPYCFCTSDEIGEVSFERTKEGYFEVDTSSLNPGRYVIGGDDILLDIE